MSEDNSKKIKECFEKLCLDERASQEEVELAYNALTKNKYGDFQGYRQAFEYLMQNVFGVIQMADEEDSEAKEVLEDSPPSVLVSISNLEEKDFLDGKTLDDRAKLAWATQNVNLPMLFNNIISNCHRFLSFNFWTVKDMTEIINNSCLNPFIYNDATFELFCDGLISKTQRIRDFVCGLKNFYGKQKTDLCKCFEVKNIEGGAMAHFIAEHELAEHIKTLVKQKADVEQCALNMVVTSDGYD